MHGWGLMLVSFSCVHFIYIFSPNSIGYLLPPFAAKVTFEQDACRVVHSSMLASKHIYIATFRSPSSPSLSLTTAASNSCCCRRP